MPNHKQQQQQHLESPPTTNDDSVEHAPESGEPSETGRSHGKPVDEKDDHTDSGKTNGDDWESGRHRAT